MSTVPSADSPLDAQHAERLPVEVRQPVTAYL